MVFCLLLKNDRFDYFVSTKRCLRLEILKSNQIGTCLSDFLVR